jgi:hypothetical protein
MAEAKNSPQSSGGDTSGSAPQQPNTGESSGAGGAEPVEPGARETSAESPQEVRIAGPNLELRVEDTPSGAPTISISRPAERASSALATPGIAGVEEQPDGVSRGLVTPGMAGDTAGSTDSPTKTLASLDFDQLIGGPLMAAVKAQAASADTTLHFLNQFAWTAPAKTDPNAPDPAKTDPRPNQPATLNSATLTYNRYYNDGSGQPKAVPASVSVPLITMVPIPFLRVQQMTIDLDVKLNRMSSSENVNDLNTNVTCSNKSWFSPVNFNVTVSDRNTNTQKSSVNDTYSMHVNVLAVQDQLPGGMSRVLDIFTDVINQQILPPPATAPADAPTPARTS